MIRLGMRAMMVVGALDAGSHVVRVHRADGIVLFIALFAVRGTGLALLDLAGNTMAMHVERTTGKYIMGIVHAGFSFGIVVGSLTAFVVYALGGGFRLIHALLGHRDAAVAIGGVARPGAAGRSGRRAAKLVAESLSAPACARFADLPWVWPLAPSS